MRGQASIARAAVAAGQGHRRGFHRTSTAPPIRWLHADVDETPAKVAPTASPDPADHPATAVVRVGDARPPTPTWPPTPAGTPSPAPRRDTPGGDGQAGSPGAATPSSARAAPSPSAAPTAS